MFGRGVESEFRDMYGTAKQKDNTTRVFGIAAVGITGAVIAVGLAFGVGTRMIAKMTETEVVIIEQEQVEEEEPPPPPPVPSV